MKLALLRNKTFDVITEGGAYFDMLEGSRENYAPQGVATTNMYSARMRTSTTSTKPKRRARTARALHQTCTIMEARHAQNAHLTLQR